MDEMYKTIGEAIADYVKKIGDEDARPVLRSSRSRNSYFLPLVKDPRPGWNEWHGVTITRQGRNVYIVTRDRRSAQQAYATFFWEIITPQNFNDGTWEKIHKVSKEVKKFVDQIQHESEVEPGAESFVLEDEELPPRSLKSKVMPKIEMGNRHPDDPPTVLATKKAQPEEEFRPFVAMVHSNNTSGFINDFDKPQWQMKEHEILRRDGYTCQWCGDTTTYLMVFNLAWKWNLGPLKWDPSDLVTLCVDCRDHGMMLQSNVKLRLNRRIRVLKIDPSTAWVFDDTPRLIYSRLYYDKQNKLKGKAMIMQVAMAMRFQEFISKLKMIHVT